MIEFCTIKRMILVVAALVVISIVVIWLEIGFAENHVTSIPEEQTNGTGKSQCWLTEQYTVIQECRACTGFEKASGHIENCKFSHYVELVSCATSGKMYKSCPPVPWIEKRNFWIFEGVSLVIGSLSWMMVIFRQKQIDNMMLERIQKQIAAGV